MADVSQPAPQLGGLDSNYFYPSPSRVASSAFKRVTDVILSAVALGALLPALLLLALLIKVESPGPAIFKQWRTGLGGRRFVVYKFRSMRREAAATAPAVVGDDRITGLGSLIRRSSIDELPQLFNVLRGEMSLVGPRPHAVEHDMVYIKEVPGYADRFAARPGLTGLAQISGSRGGGEIADICRRAELDCQYISNWSYAEDLRIILMTLPHLLWYKAH